MTHFRALPTALLLGTFLSAGALWPHSPVSAQDVTASMQANVDGAAFDRLLAGPPRIVGQDSATKALSEMGLLLSGSEALSWSNRSGGGGNYVFNNVTGEDSEGIPFTMETLTVSGLRMEGDDPVFDRIDMKGFSAKDDVYELTFDQWSMAKLTPDFSTAIVRTFHDFDVEDVFEDQFEDKNLGMPGALFIDDLFMSMDDESEEIQGDISLATLGWGEDVTTGKGRFLMRGLDVEIIDPEFENPVLVSVDNVSADGLDMETFREIVEELDFENLDDDSANDLSMVMYQDPYKKLYDRLSMDRFSVRADSLVMDLEHYSSVVTKVGDILTYTSVMKPFTLTFEGETKDPDIAELRTMMSQAGFDSLSFTAGSTTTLNETYDRFKVENAYFEFQDNARMQFDYAGKGIGAMMAAIREVGDIEKASEEQLVAIFEDVSLDYLDMSLTDMSLMNKLFDLSAKNAGVTPDLMKTKAKGMLMMGGMVAKNPAQVNFAVEASTALSAFIDQGGTVDIKVRPDVPLYMDRFKTFNPATFDPAEYGLSVTHKK